MKRKKGRARPAPRSTGTALAPAVEKEVPKVAAKEIGALMGEPKVRRTVLMIGAGAVSDSWKAVYAALKQLYPNLHEDGCTHAFANLVHRLRWLAHAARRDPTAQSALGNQLAQYSRLKEVLSAELLAAADTGRFAFASYGKGLIKRLLSESPDLKVITTNWDKTLDQLIQELGSPPKMARLHLHGLATAPSTLYLPTEALDEVYRQETERELKSLRNAHELAINWIANCDRLVVYGLNFSPHDPELGMVTVAGFHRRTRHCDIEVHDRTPAPVVANLRFYCDSAFLRSITPTTVPTGS